MNFEQLKNLSQVNEVQITSHENYTRTPEHYHEPLRNAFSSYFNTFRTNCDAYVYYAEGLSNGNEMSFFDHQILDEENIIDAMLNFQRFFELLLKRLLQKTHPSLSLKRINRNSSTNDPGLEITEALSNNRIEFLDETMNFKETIKRYYSILQLAERSNEILDKFRVVTEQYSFLNNREFRDSLEFLNWWRNRITHNGTMLPNFWFFDFIVSQKLFPIIYSVLQVEKDIVNDSLFYLKTKTGIDLLEEINAINYSFEDISNSNEKDKFFYKLLKLGHLKELGRANMNMNIYLRANVSPYDYYENPMGRAERFAQLEKEKIEDSVIKYCPCCGVYSLVRYVIKTTVSPTSNEPYYRYYVKCYSCDYHIPNEIGDPQIFKLCDYSLFK